MALFGAHDLSDPYEAERIALSPIKIIVHDDWNPRTTNYDADIALLEFEKGKIKYTEASVYIQPICLWDSTTEMPLTENLVTGWGQSENVSRVHEIIPKMIKVTIQSNGDCFLAAKDLVDLSSQRTFCAGLQNGTGVCRGDSGGGLFVDVDGVHFLKGIVSSSLLTSSNDCDVSKNAVYTNVLEYKKWIEEKMAGQGKLHVQRLQTHPF